MAEAVVSFAVKRLGDLLISEAKFLCGVSGEIVEIQRQLKRMQCFLEEADKKQIVDKRVRNWVAEMRELAFKTEDVIETFVIEVESKKQKSGFKVKLRRFACIVSEGASLHKIGTEIETIKAELSNLTASLQTFGITRGLEEGQSSNSVDLRNGRIFYSHDIENDFVGMDKEIEQMISHLTKEDKRCEVISICGMGGQGKTTVATKLYNHVQVQTHFQAFGWVCITQQFNREKTLKSILEQLLPSERKAEVTSMGDEVLVNELHKVQREKNCLVVIDDIWTTDAWRNLRSAFPIGVTKTDSKILLTTRNEAIAGVGTVYKLPGLTEDEGWQLLSKKAFSLITGEAPVEGMLSKMESIGKKMVVRCKGLPLAVSTLGGMLRGKMLREWEMISKDISFYLAHGEAGVLDDDGYHTVTHILGLSYDSLPPRLRHCFLCFANYKEDEEIRAEELYLLWMGEGLIPLEDRAQGVTMLQVAERYLIELVHRNLVQVESWEEDGESWSKFQKCRLHDLIRDLCLSRVKEEKFTNVYNLLHQVEHNLESRDNGIRRLCIHRYDLMDESIMEDFVIPQIRSLLLFSGMFDPKVEIFCLENCKLLRVLKVQGFQVSGENLRSIGKLVYLKYLSFKGCRLLGNLPSTIGNLRNLETLDVRVHQGHIRIPNVLWKCDQLKHLYLPSYHDFAKVQLEKVRFDGMNELELIEGFDSRYCETHDLIGLSKIKVLKGKIEVDDENPMIIEKIAEFIESKELCNCRLYIRGDGTERRFSLSLLLECSFIDYICMRDCITTLPKEFVNNRFSERLINLELYDCKIEEFDPMILLEKFPNLRHLYLGYKSYIGREMVCSAMGFPQLQSLELSCLPNLTNWSIDEGAMPYLSQLNISGCEKLEILPDGLEFLLALKKLFTTKMPTAFENRIRVGGQDFHKVSHIPTIIII